MSDHHTRTQKGFTIIELMIATVVFSFILVVASSGVVAIGRLYYKGVTSSRTQEGARGIMEDLTRSRQFSGYDTTPSTNPPGWVVGEPQAICFGPDRYSFRINDKVEGAGSYGLRYDNTRADLSTCPPDSGGRQLLGSNMRLLDLTVDSTIGEGRTKIGIKLAYGDNDLLDTYGNDGTTRTPVSLKDAQCKSGIAGSNFCGVSELATLVNKRIK